jgi:MoaA/NifB/PqqE/SkfB family radical SAM enzyme
MFDTQKVRDLLVNPRSKIVVSLDGFAEINSLYRNPGQFEMVLGWLLPILKEKPEQVTLLSVIYRQNYHEIVKFAQYLSSMGLEFFHLSPLKRLGRSEIAESNFVSHDEINDLQKGLDEITKEFPKFKPTISCIHLEKFKGNRTSQIPVPLFNEMHFGTGVKVTPEGDVMANRGIMFTQRFKDQYTEEACLDSLGSIYSGKSFKEIWTDSLDLRIKQGKIANDHYDYYLGWLRTLD